MWVCVVLVGGHRSAGRGAVCHRKFSTTRVLSACANRQRALAEVLRDPWHQLLPAGVQRGAAELARGVDGWRWVHRGQPLAEPRARRSRNTSAWPTPLVSDRRARQRPPGAVRSNLNVGWSVDTLTPLSAQCQRIICSQAATRARARRTHRAEECKFGTPRLCLVSSRSTDGASGRGLSAAGGPRWQGCAAAA